MSVVCLSGMNLSAPRPGLIPLFLPGDLLPARPGDLVPSRDGDLRGVLDGVFLLSDSLSLFRPDPPPSLEPFKPETYISLTIVHHH